MVQVGKASEDIKNIDKQWTEVRAQRIADSQSDYANNPAPEGYVNPTLTAMIAEVDKGEDAFKAQVRSQAAMRAGFGTIFAAAGAASTISKAMKWAKQPAIISKKLSPKTPAQGYHPGYTPVYPQKLDIYGLPTGGAKSIYSFKLRGAATFPQFGRQTIVTTNWGKLVSGGKLTSGTVVKPLFGGKGFKFVGLRPEVKTIYKGIPYGASGRAGYKKAFEILTRSVKKGGAGQTPYIARGLLRYSKPQNIHRTVSGWGTHTSGKGIKTTLDLSNVRVRTTYLGTSKSKLIKGTAKGTPSTYITKGVIKKNLKGVRWVRAEHRGKLVRAGRGELPVISPKGKAATEFVKTKYQGKIPAKYKFDAARQHLEWYPKGKKYLARSFTKELKAKTWARKGQPGEGIVVVGDVKIPVKYHPPAFKVQDLRPGEKFAKKVLAPLKPKDARALARKYVLEKRQTWDKGGYAFPQRQIPRPTLKPKPTIFKGGGGGGGGGTGKKVWPRRHLTPAELKIGSEVGGGVLPYFNPAVIDDAVLIIEDIGSSRLGAISAPAGLLKYDVDSKLKSGMDLYTESKVTLDVTQDLEQEPVLGSESVPVVTSVTPSIQEVKVTQALQPIQATQLIQATPQIQAITPLSRSPQPQPQRPTIKTPKIIRLIPTKPKLIKRKSRVVKRERLFTPVIRRYGKWTPYGKPTTRKKAIKKGVKILRGTLGASLKIVGKKSKKPLKFAKETKEFRYGKKGPTILVQRKGKRLSAFGERVEIIRAKKGFKFI